MTYLRKLCLLSSRILKENMKIFFYSKDTALQSYMMFILFFQFVMTSSGSHGNYCLLSMIYFFYWGYLHTKLEV